MSVCVTPVTVCVTPLIACAAPDPVLLTAPPTVGVTVPTAPPTLLVVRWTVEPTALRPPTTSPSVPTTWCTPCCTGWGTTEPGTGLGPGADPQPPAAQVGDPDDPPAPGTAAPPPGRVIGGRPPIEFRVPDPTVRPAPVGACPAAPAAPAPPGPWAAVMNASRRATGEMAAEAERGETTTSPGEG